MKNPLVTIVIPVYNGARTITKSIESVLSQTLKDWEIICVDDGSTDSTLQVVERLCGRYDGIRMLKSEKNCGPLSARLAGVKEAKGNYIAFLDCGDKLAKDGLQQMVLAATATDADVTIGASTLVLPHLYKICYSKPRTVFERYMLENESRDDVNKQIYRGMLEGSLSASIWDKIYRREWLLEQLPQSVDFKIGEDYYFISAVMAHARIVHFTDADFYQWTYSGLAGKYFLKGYKTNAKAMECVMDCVGSHSQACGMTAEEAESFVAYKFLYQSMLGIAEHLRLHRSEKKSSAFAQEMFRLPIFAKALAYVREFKGFDTADITPEIMVTIAKGHLHRHKKYYIFTRILNLIYRK